MICKKIFAKTIDIIGGWCYIIAIGSEVIALYSYHNRIKQRIKNGELVDHYFTQNYPGIGEALVLVFKTSPFLRPVRPHKYFEYKEVIG